MEMLLVTVNYYNGEDYEDACFSNETLGIFSSTEKINTAIKNFYLKRKYLMRHLNKIEKKRHQRTKSRLTPLKFEGCACFDIITKYSYGRTETEYYSFTIESIKIDEEREVDI